ncbi:peptidase M50 [Mangrovicoccus sp. HB161399]|uniref:peptidase M50 n=1 Tax=Mangrovicoccus sp. HB161399 TaxID=2720392 RepID=UPI001553C359|nr:peptidase M50 [Mangrovicoccus sp. HB161399]
MATSLFSPSWYRVAQLKPRLRKHVEIHRHDYRGRIWYILQDHAAGRSHRLSPAAYRLVGLMDGQRSVEQLWQLANEQLAERAPTQDEAIRLLGQLHAADAMICDVPPDSRELFRRFKRQEEQKLKQKIWSPLAVRIPVWDPDRFLARTYPFVAPLFTRTGMALWAALVLAGVVLAVMNFGAITDNIFDRALTVQNLMVLWLVYPAVKAVHELGHGYAVKANGGEVHEIGIMLLVLIPVPYVDASAASALRDKKQRMLIGGIGIMVELALASAALLFWLNAEAGPAHVVAYNVMLIGGVSTLLFNGNPLLRFDGYYVFADFLEIPNLGSRANSHIFYLAQKYLFGSKEAEPVTSLASERFWFVAYGIAAFLYRLSIMFAIILYIGGRFFFIGVILAFWAATTQALVPIFNGVKFLSDSPKLRTNRGRAVWTTAGIVALLAALLFAMPFPLRTMADAVTWPSEQSQIRAQADGFVTAIPVRNRDSVAEGDVILTAEDPLLAARRDLIAAQIVTLSAQEAALRRQDRVQAELAAEELAAARAQLGEIERRMAELTLTAPRAGEVVLPNPSDLESRFMRKGGLVGYVVDAEDTRRMRMMIGQDRVALVRDRTRGVELMPAGYGTHPVPALIVRETPGGTTTLPTPSLGTGGGGEIPVDPRDPDGRKTLERFFEFELALDEGTGSPFLGQRARVKIDHGYEPIGFQAWRSLRQLFLRLYGV